MRMSCNGCRVLRKGCSEDCTIRPCLQWIKNPESQGNATVFLAKFYGRAGLLNLINAGSDSLRPAIFRSLLYEACGRIVNPIYGSVGLLWSGNWQLCQAAVEAVLKGAPIIQIPSEKAAAIPMPPLKAFDIRHVNKNTTTAGTNASSGDLHKVSKSSRTPFKRSGSPNSSNSNTQQQRQEESSGSHDHDCASGGGRTTSSSGSMVSAEVMEPSTPEQKMTDEVELDLTLGLGLPVKKMSSPGSTPSCPPPAMKKISSDGQRFNLALDLTV